MLRYLLFSLFLFISIISYSKELHGKIVKVVDGDTVVLLDSTNTQYRIRLDGIDCPEKGQPFGAKATSFVKELAAGKNAIVIWNKKDRYGRILGYLIVNDTNINKELLRNGLAWHYKYFNKNQELSDLEQVAKAKKMNIWSDKNPIEPYLWRKGNRQ